MAPMIQTKGLRKVYRVGKERVVALDRIDISIAKGEVCCIVGQSGSGKSTLLNQLAGLEKPTKGEVIIAGKTISSMTESQLAKFRQDNLGFIFQSYNLLPSMDAVENVALPLMFKGVPRAKREKVAKAALRALGLKGREHHRPTEMSGGQQQRVGIARAFVSRPSVIFADEPTGNLDTATTRQVLKKMLELAEKYQITFIMVTHEPELAGVADRIITLLDGKILSNVTQTEAEKNAVRAALFAEPDAPEAETPPADNPENKERQVDKHED